MYRENISDFIQGLTKENKGITLYVPKNGGLDYVKGMLPKIGINLESGKVTKNGKDLGTLVIEYERGEDIPKLVEEDNQRGKESYGLTGDDIFDEYILKNRSEGFEPTIKVLNTYDWNDPDAESLRPALTLMNKTGTWNKLKDNPTFAINNEFSMTSLTYLQERFGKKGLKYKVRSYNGNVEKRVSDGRADACIEIVYRGNKSRDSAKSKNGLKTVEIIRFSDISLIGPDRDKIPKEESLPTNIWAVEYKRIEDRVINPTDSYTSRLLADRNEIVKKAGQEFAELVKAYATNKNLTGEALDMIYSTMLMLAYSGVKWNNLEEELTKRWK